MIRVLLDTNVIISALLFPGSTPDRVLRLVLDEDRLVLTDWILAELHEVVGRKRSDLLPALDTFLESVDFEIAEPDVRRMLITDPRDQPILDAALASAVDVIVTGDKHFHSLDLERPQVLTPRMFIESLGPDRTGQGHDTRITDPPVADRAAADRDRRGALPQGPPLLDRRGRHDQGYCRYCPLTGATRDALARDDAWAATVAELAERVTTRALGA